MFKNGLPKLTLCMAAASLIVITSPANAFRNYDGNYGGNYKGYKGDGGFTYKQPAYKEPVRTVVTNPGLLDGFYVGIQGGYDSYRMREDLTAVDADGDFASINPALNAVGFVGGLFAGYGQYLCSPFYLGGEAFFNISGAYTSRTFAATIGGLTQSYVNTISVNKSYGLSIIPGYKITDYSLLYLKGGWTKVNMKTKETLTDDDGTVVTGSTNRWPSGYGVGLGLETLIMDEFSIRTEFMHYEFNSFRTVNGAKISPVNNQAMLGLIYHFYV